jgi:hypothetical protein
VATSRTLTKRRGQGNGRDTTLPPLEPDDDLNQKTFHARYEAMPEDFRAEHGAYVRKLGNKLRRRSDGV